MNPFHLLTALGAVLLGTTSVKACIFNAPAPDRINRVRADTVVIGVVTKALYGKRSRFGERPWNGTVQLKRVVRGNTEAGRFVIGRTGSSSECDDGTKAPASGDLWVVYLRTEGGKDIVLLSYPLSVAREADPRLRHALNGR